MKICTIALAGVLALALGTDVVTAQPPGGRERPRGQRPGPPRGQDGRGPDGRGPDGRGPEDRGPGFVPPRFPLMVALDADEDGEISAKEIENAVAALKKLDKNEDGKLAREELRPQFGPGGPGGPGGFGPGGPGRGDMVGHIMSFDENEDGKVTKEELPEPMHRMFQHADANQDGAIDKEEAETMAERARGGPGGRGGGDILERLMRRDRDGDGKLTKEELPEWMQQEMFDESDTNGDGAIDKEEAKKMAEQFRGRGGPPRGPGPGRNPDERVPRRGRSQRPSDE
ncbi:MAG: EF-hand domain-containing protein [Planctomycetota bacterium]